jgi:hypothetical protein
MIVVWIVVAVIAFGLLALWPPTPKSIARLLRRVAVNARVLPRAKRNRLDLIGWIVRRPALLTAINAYETAIILCNGADTRMKYLATLKASSLAGCPF